MNIFQQITTILIVAIVAWCLFYHWGRRRLYYHSWKIKGPFALPLLGSALHFLGPPNDFLNVVVNLVKNYESPSRFWLGNRLFFAVYDPKNLEVVLNSSKALGKAYLYDFLKTVVGDGLFTAKPSIWKRNRKIIAPTFNQRILNSFFEVFVRNSEILIEQLQKKAGRGTFDAFDYIGPCSLDIICETAMGVTVHAQTKEEHFMEWISKSLHIHYTRFFRIWYYFDCVFEWSGLAKELQGYTNNIYKFTEKITAKRKMEYVELQRNRKEASEAHEDEYSKKSTFLDNLIELSENGANFSDEEIRNEVITFMFGGSDTTSSVNSFALIMLGLHQKIQQTLYEEIIDVIGYERAVQCEDLPKLQFLDRILRETMRLFPVGPVVARQSTSDIHLENCTIPEGCSIALFPIILHRDPKIWKNPLRFDPDRFLPEEVAKRHPYSWIPFLNGPRNCIGMRYALMSMKCLLAMVVRKYQVFTDYKSVEDVKLEAHGVLKPSLGYNISIVLRDCRS